MGLTVLWANPGSAWLFVLPTITAALAYRAYISERQQHESIELLYESTRILQRSPQLDTAIVSLLDHARKMFRADVAEIRLLPRHEGDEVLRCQVGPGDAVVVMQPVGLALDDPILVRAVTERQGRLVDLPPVEGADGTTRRNGRKALVAPLTGESTLVGTLLVSDSLSDISTFEPEDLKLFETLANHTAIALENGRLEQSLEQLGRLKEELHHQALHDPLTGLANRSLFTQVVASRLEARDPSGTVPIVLFVDLDDFKLVNDSLGHAAGDALLVAVGDRLGSVLRSSDMAARLGGDEFAVLLRDTPDMKASMRVANRLTAAMGSFFEIEGRDVNVRASVGVAAGRPGIETRRRPAAQRRRRDVFGEGARQGPGGRLRALDARGGDGPCPAVGRPRARDLRPRVRPAVPADRGDRDGPDGRRRGARALGAPRARPDRPGRLHPGGRGVRLDPRDRPLGAEPGLSSGPMPGATW